MARRRAKTIRPPWMRLSNSRLLSLRLCDLRLDIRQSEMAGGLEEVFEELGGCNIRCCPPAWVSDEWFTPDHVPGIGIPFYLGHKRLRELERSQMLEVEGGTHDWAMRILRHEAGHAIDNAYRLHRRKGYRALFGRWSDPYPT